MKNLHFVGLVLLYFILGVLCTINCSTYPITLQIWPTLQKVLEHGIATFNCNTTIYPVPSIYWRRNGRRLDNTPTYQVFNTWDGSILRVENVKAKRDDALFECVFEGPESEIYSEKATLRVIPIELKPIGFPKINDTSTLMLVEEDDLVIMPCEYGGNPKPIVTWIKDHMPIDVDDHKYYILENKEDDGSLLIDSLNDMDDGIYECIAENEMGLTYGAPIGLTVETYESHE